MDDLMLIIGVAGLFLLRIGIPVLLLITLGILIDRWQTKRDKQVSHFQDRFYGDRRYEELSSPDPADVAKHDYPEATAKDRKPVEQH